MSDMPDVRAEEKDLMLRILAGQREPAIISLVRLLELRLLKYQNRMLDCTYEAFPALQAEAQVTERLIRELKPKQN